MAKNGKGLISLLMKLENNETWMVEFFGDGNKYMIENSCINIIFSSINGSFMVSWEELHNMLCKLNYISNVKIQFL